MFKLLLSVALLLSSMVLFLLAVFVSYMTQNYDHALYLLFFSFYLQYLVRGE